MCPGVPRRQHKGKHKQATVELTGRWKCVCSHLNAAVWMSLNQNKTLFACLAFMYTQNKFQTGCWRERRQSSACQWVGCPQHWNFTFKHIKSMQICFWTSCSKTLYNPEECWSGLFHKNVFDLDWVLMRWTDSVSNMRRAQTYDKVPENLAPDNLRASLW